jgi:hypothetical protein
MRLHRVFAVSMLLTCSAYATDKIDDEAMYDLASTFKDLTQRVDGFVKFSGAGSIQQTTLLKDAGAQSIIETTFRGFDVEFEIQGKNVVMVLCKKDRVLIEDAGCNSKLDGPVWKQANQQSCQVRIQASQVCN